MKKEAVPIMTNQQMTTSSNSIGIDINQEFAWSIQVESATTSGSSAATGSGFCSAGDTITYNARVTIANWQA